MLFHPQLHGSNVKGNQYRTTTILHITYTLQIFPLSKLQFFTVSYLPIHFRHSTYPTSKQISMNKLWSCKLFRLRLRNHGKDNLATGTVWPPTLDHCKIYSVHCRIYGETRVLKREDKWPTVAMHGHGFPSIKNWWLFCSEQLHRQIIHQNARIFKRNWLIPSPPTPPRTARISGLKS